MLKAVFVGSENKFNQILVHWLSQRVEIQGVVWIKATAWQRTLKGRIAFARKRMKKYGLAKVIDETIYHLYFHRFLHASDKAALERNVFEPYWAEHGQPKWTGAEIDAENVNRPEAISFIEEREPDLVFAMCINNFFGKKLRSIPKQGVMLWHEGITPEYKGLYSPFWTVHNLDFDRIGYTLLRMNDKLDAGEIFVQGAAEDVDPRRHHNYYLGHKAIADSLPEVDKFLKSLEAGTETPIERPDAEPGYYTYPGFTDYLRQQYRLRQ